MSHAVCLRCDWEGETADAICPECGAPLYRSAVRSTETPIATTEGSAGPDPARGDRTTARRYGPIAIAAAVTVAAVTVASLWIRADTPKAAVAEPPAGSLVYAEDLGDGTARLWRWDLAATTVRAGPRVPDPVELVDASGAGEGWVGVTSRRSRTELQASVLRSFAPGTRPAPLIRGDLIDWGPEGVGVVAGIRSPVAGDCQRRISTVYLRIAPRERTRQFSRRLCGDLLSVARGGVVTFFTLQRRDAVRVAFVSLGLVRTVLPNYAMIDASPVGDLLVVPGTALMPRRLAPWGSRADPDRPPTGVFGTALFFRGRDVVPIPYGRGAEPFAIDRVMAWSPDGLTALVTGRLGDHPGLFEVDGGPGKAPRAPRFVGPFDGLTWATYAGDGTAFISSERGVWIARDEHLVPLDMPDGAPAPSGPIVWVP